MFTLGEKIEVINTDSLVKVFDNANSEVVTSAAIANTDRLLVEGFGHFNVAEIVNIQCRRAVAPVNESKDYTAIVPSGIAIGDAVEVVISLDTSRYQAEVLTQIGIGKGRTIKFQSSVLTAIAAADIRTAIVAGWTTYKSLFNKAEFPIEVSAGTAATSVRVASTTGYESITVDRVEIRRVSQGIATQPFTSLAIAATNDVGTEGLGQGKFLEESIRMATGYNNDPYGSNNQDHIVDLRGSYTQVYWESAVSYTENLGTTAADFAHQGIGGPAVGGVPANHSFTLYLNESTCLAANGAIDKLAAIALLRSAVYSYLTATVDATPDQDTEVMFLADGTSVATTAAFIA